MGSRSELSGRVPVGTKEFPAVPFTLAASVAPAGAEAVASLIPTVETVGYFRVSLAGQKRGVPRIRSDVPRV